MQLQNSIWRLEQLIPELRERAARRKTALEPYLEIAFQILDRRLAIDANRGGIQDKSMTTAMKQITKNATREGNSAAQSGQALAEARNLLRLQRNLKSNPSDQDQAAAKSQAALLEIYKRRYKANYGLEANIASKTSKISKNDGDTPFMEMLNWRYDMRQYIIECSTTAEEGQKFLNEVRYLVERVDAINEVYWHHWNTCEDGHSYFRNEDGLHLDIHLMIQRTHSRDS